MIKLILSLSYVFFLQKGCKWGQKLLPCEATIPITSYGQNVSLFGLDRKVYTSMTGVIKQCMPKSISVKGLTNVEMRPLLSTWSFRLKTRPQVHIQLL